MPDMLDAEVARAMSGRPAWRVVAACVKGGACHRCGRPIGTRCHGPGSPCRERVWAQRARERAAGRVLRAYVSEAQSFIDVIARERLAVGATANSRMFEPPAMDAAIACGLVRLAISGGVMPVWVVTEHAVEQAAALSAVVQGVAPDAPSAPPVNALAAVVAFHARMSDGAKG